jgi:hypothetical protein
MAAPICVKYYKTFFVWLFAVSWRVLLREIFRVVNTVPEARGRIHNN